MGVSGEGGTLQHRCGDQKVSSEGTQIESQTSQVLLMPPNTQSSNVIITSVGDNTAARANTAESYQMEERQAGMSRVLDFANPYKRCKQVWPFSLKWASADHRSVFEETPGFWLDSHLQDVIQNSRIVSRYLLTNRVNKD